MNEKPILFSGPMVRAILEGRKTMTRRVVKHHNMLGNASGWCAAAAAKEPWWVGIIGDYRRFCPYGRPGDTLWVRETFGYDPFHAQPAHQQILYRATFKGDPDYPVKWRPSIFMPRAACRIMLRVENVRVERLHDITEADARAEGIADGGCLTCGHSEPCGCANPQPDARDAFVSLWDNINAKRGYGWDSDPWVWVVEFETTTTKES